MTAIKNLPGWALCGPLCATGSRQSPINLVAAVQYPQMGSISYSTLGVDPLLVWSNTSYTLIGTNNAANGSFSITYAAPSPSCKAQLMILQGRSDVLGQI